MGALHSRFQAGQVAIIQGVGYPSPNLSHFRSMEIWHTAVPDAYVNSGWLGRELSAAGVSDPLAAVSVTDGVSPALGGPGGAAATIPNIGAYAFRTDARYGNDRAPRMNFVRSAYGRAAEGGDLESVIAEAGLGALASTQRVQDRTSGYQPAATYPNFALASNLKTIAQLMLANLGTRIFYTQFGGFDTHSNQPNTHARLLAGFSNSVDAFFKDLEARGTADRVVVMTFSEFGRRVQENGSQGTDHGTAGPMFVVGPAVRGGLYGQYPSLTALDDNRNLNYQVDFRSVYGSALEGWLGVDQQAALGARYERLGFL
jgi:uncharacterized protein (DUF1501 family)